MFTGIISAKATVVERLETSSGLRFKLSSELFEKPQIGASFAINGVCLTQVNFKPNEATFDVIDETLSKTTLKRLQKGDQVHIEPALMAQSTLDGHMVQGHVDGVATIEEVCSSNLKVRVPEDFQDYLVAKGSIALDGVSLTIADLNQNVVTIALTPHTYQETLFQFQQPGDLINFEIDMFAKMVFTYLSRLQLKEVNS